MTVNLNLSIHTDDCRTGKGMLLAYCDNQAKVETEDAFYMILYPKHTLGKVSL